MNGWAIAGALVAQLSNWQHLGDGLRGSRAEVDWAQLWPYLAASAAAIVAIAAYVAYRRHYDFSRRTNDPPRLFRELCVIHQLNGTHRKMLWQLADELQLGQPAQVFLMPSAFTAPGLPAPLQKRAAEYAVLRERLF